MTPLKELKRVEAAETQLKKDRLKPRRVRRQVERERVKAAKLNQKKNDRLSA